MSVIPGITNSFGEGQALQYGGTSTVEAVSISPVVAGVANEEVTATTATGIVSYTPSQDGVFRLEAYVYINNGTTSNTITLSATYTDLKADASETVYFTSGATVLDAAATVANGVYPCEAIIVPVKGGTTITITYTDSTHTPADYVTAIISQVA